MPQKKLGVRVLCRRSSYMQLADSSSDNSRLATLTRKFYLFNVNTSDSCNTLL